MRYSWHLGGWHHSQGSLWPCPAAGGDMVALLGAPESPGWSEPLSCQRSRGQCCPDATWDVLSSPQDGKLYWCDARTDKIERIDLETGENREVVLSSNNMDMFSVSVFEEYIYWSDRCGAKGAGGCVEELVGVLGRWGKVLCWSLGDSVLLQDSRQRLHQKRQQGQRHRVGVPADWDRRPAQGHQSL